jgi:phosphate starvation-inducible PhoH-like protein
MIERIIYLEGIDPVQIYGTNNVLLEKIIFFFPKIKIIARGDEIKVIGETEELDRFEEKINSLIDYYHEFNHLSLEDVEQVVSERVVPPKPKISDVLIYGTRGQPIKARTTNQVKLIEAYEKHDLIMAIGPAGTGKTYTSIALAVRALKNKQVRKIVLTRPAVEAGEHLGFLPGDLKEKLDPYLQPLYDALNDMIPHQKLSTYLEDTTIQIAPLAFMRGRTLENAFVILDEGQNATIRQLKMFLTRMGNNSKFIITGDITQIDLPSRENSGLLQAMRILKEIPGITSVFFDSGDIVRHRLVKDIVRAYDDEDQKLKNGKNGEKITGQTIQ